MLLGTLTSAAPSRRSSTAPPSRTATGLLNRTQKTRFAPSASSSSAAASALQSVSASASGPTVSSPVVKVSEMPTPVAGVLASAMAKQVWSTAIE